MNLIDLVKTFFKPTELTQSEKILLDDIKKRNELCKRYSLLLYDLKEYTEHPTETISVLSIQNQINHIIIEIKRFDHFINQRHYQIINEKIQELTQIALTKENEINKAFTSADCPKISQSLFNQPFI